ncbi:hypothetical protein Z517_00002 [Fonsecaea pedrosoi CBS 271.37]|uniref:Uncharacterized protein n=1 Tax=Fonsecaea pedrosoi CBS 271.37 TaxID=1442368 RepID=A0A0D2HJI2_9EURO|nr:uncharacterized protein Z517_00002 [Fonsecaea pedrosoi CBS 271.37]KIW84614.1 hypothetical protein Z517_00002 [Fonsecaea pedrosoi CBS 271.37]
MEGITALKVLRPLLDRIQLRITIASENRLKDFLYRGGASRGATRSNLKSLAVTSGLRDMRIYRAISLATFDIRYAA